MSTVPLAIEFPESLPVSGRRDEIMEAMRQHQVIIVCGETGSGKTTQLPKIALALGRGKCNAPPGQKGQLIGQADAMLECAYGHFLNVRLSTEWPATMAAMRVWLKDSIEA